MKNKFGFISIFIFALTSALVPSIASAKRTKTASAKRSAGQKGPYRIYKKNRKQSVRLVNPTNRRPASTPAQPESTPGQMDQEFIDMMMIMGLLSAINGMTGSASQSNNGDASSFSPGSSSFQSETPSGPAITYDGPTISAGDCSKIDVNCQTHLITITTKSGKTIKETINCGKPGNPNCKGNGMTPTTTGKVNGLHSGTRVPAGIDIKGPGMGQDGGGKVFHTPSPAKSKCQSMVGCNWGTGQPQGINSTCGCVAVSPKMMNNIAACNGVTVSIIGTDGKGNPQLSKPAAVQQAKRGPTNAR